MLIEGHPMVLARVMVDTAVESGGQFYDYLPERLEIAFWQAAKHGVTWNQINPGNGSGISSPDLMAKLLRVIEPALRAIGDYDFAVHSLRNILEMGNDAVRQPAAFDRGSIRHVLANAHAKCACSGCVHGYRKLGVHGG